MELNLESKVALVFGGSKGIGFETAKLLHLSGATVCIVSRSMDNLKRAEDDLQLETGRSPLIFKGDIKSYLNISEIASFMEKNANMPDIVVNNSGGPPMGSFKEHTEEIWIDSFEQHLLGLVRILNIFSDNMVEKGWGRIVNISSSVAIEPTSIMSVSATIRAGISALSKSASLTLAESGVTINTICPGGVATDRLLSLISDQSVKTGKSVEELLSDAQSSIPMKRFAEPNEVASLALFLCSSGANYITGRVHTVDGGLVQGF